MKKIVTYIFLLFLTLLVSCYISGKKQYNKKYFKFNDENVKINILNLEKVAKTKPFSVKHPPCWFWQKITTKTDTTFACLTANKEIILYNKNNIIKKINFKVSNPYLYRFLYINKDSIFLQYSSDNYNYHDSCILLANDRGKILKAYSFKGSNVLSHETLEFENNDNSIGLLPNEYEPFTYRDNKIFLHFESGASYLGNFAYANLPIAGYIDVKENKYHPININFPDIPFDNKHFFPASDKRFFSTFSHDGDLLYAFKYTPTIIKYNYKTRKSRKIQIKSTIFDTVHSFASEKEVPKGFDFDMPYPKYYTLEYDNVLKLYFRFILLPPEYGKYQFSVVIADTAFNIVGEGLVGHRMKMGLEKGYAKEKGWLKKITFLKGTNQELIAKIKLMNLHRKRINKTIDNYAKHFGKIKNKNYTAVFMWISGTCESVSKGVINYFQHNSDLFENNNVYLFLIAYKSPNLNQQLKDVYNLSLGKCKNIIIDSTLRYASYTNYGVHALPRTIKVRNKKMVTDTIFPGENEGYDFQKFLLNSAEEQKKLK